MVILVAGGAGFVGSHLCERLIADGHEVLCLDNLVTGRLGNLSPVRDHPRFRFIHHDIIDALPSLPRVEQIYHLASPASPPAYQRHAVETMRVNGEGTRRLLDVALRDGARHLFASTSEVYGDPLEHPQREDYRGNVSTTGPRSMYDEAKRYGEALLMAYQQALGADVRIVRIFNTYGPRMDPCDGRVVSNLIVRSLRGEPLPVYGDGQQTRSFQYVDDLVEGLVRLMASDYSGPVNIGNPTELTVLELAHLIRELTGSEAPIEFCPLPGDDPKLRRPDIELAKAVLGWEPIVALRDGLLRTIAYFRDELRGSRAATANASAAER